MTEIKPVAWIYPGDEYNTEMAHMDACLDDEVKYKCEPLYDQATIDALQADTRRMDWLAKNMRSLWDGLRREHRTERGDYRLPDIGLVESERTRCTADDLRAAIDAAMQADLGDRYRAVLRDAPTGRK